MLNTWKHLNFSIIFKLTFSVTFGVLTPKTTFPLSSLHWTFITLLPRFFQRWRMLCMCDVYCMRVCLVSLTQFFFVWNTPFPGVFCIIYVKNKTFWTFVSFHRDLTLLFHRGVISRYLSIDSWFAVFFLHRSIVGYSAKMSFVFVHYKKYTKFLNIRKRISFFLARLMFVCANNVIVSTHGNSIVIWMRYWRALSQIHMKLRVSVCVCVSLRECGVFFCYV